MHDLGPRGMTPRGRLRHEALHSTDRDLAAAAVAIPALAQGAPERAPGTIRAVDFGFENPATGDNTVTINAGETVTFTYPERRQLPQRRVRVGAADLVHARRRARPGPVPPLPTAPTGAGVDRLVPVQRGRDVRVRLRRTTRS